MGVRPGLRVSSGIVDLSAAAGQLNLPAPGETLGDWMDLGALAVLADVAGATELPVRRLDDIQLAAPYRPRKSVIRVGGPAEAQPATQSAPRLGYYSKSPAAVDPGAVVTWSRALTEQVHAEPQLAVVIGRRASYVAASEALDYVFGYSACLDLSAADLATKQSQLDKASSLDGFFVWGPEVVTRPGVREDALEVRLWLNEELVVEVNTSDAILSTAEVISELSTGITLEPGDVVLTGVPTITAHGTDRWLQSDDKLRLDIAGIGGPTASVEVKD